jgi:hypothetical protein
MLGGYCRGQPRGSPKKRGESCLKPAKNAKRKPNLGPNTKHTHNAIHAVAAPRPIEAAQQSAPSSEVRLARGLKPPRMRSASLEGSRRPRAWSASLEGPRLLERGPPRSRVPASLERGPPRSRFPHERTYSRTRVRAFNALTRQSRATTRLGITPRRCSANSLGGAHPRHCGELFDETGVSSVTLCRPLWYG